MGASFDNIQKSIINSSQLPPFRCLILDVMESDYPDFFKLKILLNQEINEEVLINKESLFNKENTKIEYEFRKNSIFKEEEEREIIGNIDNKNILDKRKIINHFIMVNQYKGIVMKSQLYCQIVKFKIQEKNNNYIDIMKKNKFHFMKSVYIDLISFLYNQKEKMLISIYLNSIKNISDGSEFKDLKETKITLNKNVQPNKIFFFNNIFYEPKKQSFQFIENLSCCEEINSSLTTNSNVFQINKYENRIIKGRVISAKFTDNIIQVKISNSNDKKDIDIVNIQLNNNLIKDITFNGISYFINFQEQKGRNYIYKAFSHIIIDERTIIEIHFKDYNDTNKYDAIKINSQLIKIDNKIIKIELRKMEEKSYFREKINYMKNNKIIHTFIIELYKGRINKFISYINLPKDGFYYEFLIFAKYEEHLKFKHKIFLDNNFINLSDLENFEKFDNKLKGRLCIINIPEQILDKEDKKSKNMCNSYKYLFLVPNENTMSINKFKLDINKEEKRYYSMDVNYEKQLNDFYNKYHLNINEYLNNFKKIEDDYKLLFGSEEDAVIRDDNYFNNNINIQNDNIDNDSEDEALNDENEDNFVDKRRLIKINQKVLDEKNNYRKYIELSFRKYIFDDSEIQYEQIKKLCFLNILKYSSKKNYIRREILISLLSCFDNIIKSSANLKYIDRIRILLSFTNNRIFDKDFRYKKFSTFLINLNDQSANNCTYIREAYKILYQIIDNLNESSSLFIALHQLNSYIEYDYITNEEMFSSSILTVNDVKFDFIKNNHGYFFVNDSESNKAYAYYCPYTKLIYYNPYVFISPDENSDILELGNNIVEIKATCVSLYLTLHEDCGHLKNGINNIEVTPRQFYDNKLVIKQKGVKKITDSGYIIEYYLKKGVVHAKKMMGDHEISDLENLLNYKYYIDSDLNQLKILLDKILEEGDDEIDYEKMDIPELFDLLIQKPENMSKKEYDKYLKNNKGYILLKKYYSGRTKP